MTKYETADLQRFATADASTDETDDCDCENLPEDTPCFECFLEGAEFGEVA